MTSYETVVCSIEKKKEGEVVLKKTVEKFDDLPSLGETKKLIIKEIENTPGNGLRHYPLCYGKVALLSVSKEQNVLVCNKCFLRIPIPSNIITLGDLMET